VIKIALMHEQFASGNMFTAGPSGGHTGVSGLNDLTGRFNFGIYDFPQVMDQAFTTNAAGNITQVIVSGPTHAYQYDALYNAEQNPTNIIVSGASIGSVITYNYWYQTGSGITSTGSLISGTVAVS